MLLLYICYGLCRCLSDKQSTYHRRRHRFHPWVGKTPGGGNGKQYSCLENPMDRGAWRATAYGVKKSQT